MALSLPLPLPILLGIFAVLFIIFWIIIKLTKFFFKAVIILAVVSFLFAAGLGTYLGHRIPSADLAFFHQGQTLVLKDAGIWNSLDHQTKRFNFNDLNTQYLVFDWPASVILSQFKVGQVIKLPAISKTELPDGITFVIRSKRMTDGKLFLGVIEPPDARLLTKQALAQLLKQAGGKKKH